jgi:large conductance mechanosensitive channel
MLKGFKEFVMRGNVVELAVAFVLGAAFTAIVNAIVNGLINPIIAAIFGKPDLTQVANFTVNGAQFSLGLILAALFNFLVVAAAIYFIVVLPMNKLLERLAERREPEPEAPSAEVLLLTEIRDSLRAR